MTALIDFLDATPIGVALLLILVIVLALNLVVAFVADRRQRRADKDRNLQ